MVGTVRALQWHRSDVVMMSGYTRKNRNKKITFTEGELAGLEITVRPMTIGELVAVTDLAEGIDSAMKMAGGIEQIRATAASIDAVLDQFASKLASWNMLDEDGQPVPATRVELGNLDQEEAMRLVSGWLEGIGSVGDPLDKRSSDGAPSPVASIPMDVLSPDLRRLPDRSLF